MRYNAAPTMPPRSSPLRRRTPSLALAAGIVLAATATGAPRPARASEPAPIAVRLRSPIQGQVLAGGELAVLAWEAEALAPGVEEWEAFLSVDGGARYPLRVTPHLDRRIQRFAFRVPNVGTTRARLLLRFGDERQEREIDAGLDLTIAPALSPPLPTSPRVHQGPGEAARPGLAGTVAWIDGGRASTTRASVITSGTSTACRSSSAATGSSCRPGTSRPSA